MSRRVRAPALPATEAPRLLRDGAVAALVLIGVGYFMRHAITPDGVAYLENAELFAKGRWGEAIQGYWSPGFSLLLAPAAWLAGDDRARLLLVAHVLQVALGCMALWLAATAVHRRVPVHAQRAVFWGCAWVILRWLTQEFLTPDLLLCTLLLLFVVQRPARHARDELWLGLTAGAGFLVKSSIWPWLLVAVAVVAARSLRAHSWRSFPTTTVAVASGVAGVFVVALSIRAGHPTLGGVGPLNARWYLGDVTRRTPDTDRGPHAARRSLMLPSGVTAAVYDLRPSTRTYAPWSDPERWAVGVPTSSLSALNVNQTLRSWKQNAGELLRWLVPLAAGLMLSVAWSLGGGGGTVRDRALDRPLAVVGASAALVFSVVHAEQRLLAPAALLLLLGVWRDAALARPRAHFKWLAGLLTAGVWLQLAWYVPPAVSQAIARDASEQPFHEYFAANLAHTPARGVIVVGTFGMWMGLLWQHHLRVAVQAGDEGVTALGTLTDAQRARWLHDEFGEGTLGVCYTLVRSEGGSATVRREFAPW